MLGLVIMPLPIASHSQPYTSLKIPSVVTGNRELSFPSHKRLRSCLILEVQFADILWKEYRVSLRP